MKIDRETLVIQMADEVKMMNEEFDRKRKLNVESIPHTEMPL